MAPASIIVTVLTDLIRTTIKTTPKLLYSKLTSQLLNYDKKQIKINTKTLYWSSISISIKLLSQTRGRGFRLTNTPEFEFSRTLSGDPTLSTWKGANKHTKCLRHKRPYNADEIIP